MVGGIETGNGQGTGIKRRGCNICRKENFFPEESFQNWGNYVKALASTKSRFKDRLLARSDESQELNEMRARSQHEMKRNLTWWDLIWFGLGTLTGSGVFVLTGQAASKYAGAAVIISFLISGISALLSAVCYTEFAVELPVAGGSFAYLRVELGDFMAYIAAGNILFEYVASGATVARSWTSYFATLCNHNPDDFRLNVSSLAENYNHLDPIAVAISILICCVASFSMKGSSRFTSIATIAHVAVVAFIVVAGMIKANPANMSPFAPFGAQGVLKASSVLFFVYVGFDGVATLAEETKKPARDIPIGLIGSMVITVIIYCLMAATLSLMQPYNQIDVDAPFSVAFTKVGLNWVKYIVSLGALKGMTTVLLTNLIGQARYFTHIARTHMAPPILAAIHEKTGTPVNATIVMTVANSVVAFFTNLDVLANLLSISTLFIFSLVALALLVRRYYVAGETSNRDRNKLIGLLMLIVASSITSAICWGANGKLWIGYTVTLPIWFLATLGLQLSVKQARKPKWWGAPFLPWLPSASIAVNVFIMGSVDLASFLRFLGWTSILLLYYVFVALHASFDAAKEAEKGRAEHYTTQATDMELANSTSQSTSLQAD